MNEYKKECWQRYLENQKYEKYDKEDLIDEIIELKSQTTQLINNWNELEKYLNEQIQRSWEIEEQCYETVLDKMEEIEKRYEKQDN